MDRRAFIDFEIAGEDIYATLHTADGMNVWSLSASEWVTWDPIHLTDYALFATDEDADTYSVTIPLAVGEGPVIVKFYVQTGATPATVDVMLDSLTWTATGEASGAPAHAMNPVRICNLALARIGQSELIQSFEEASQSAQTCRAIYDMARDQVLTEGRWPFATQRRLLGRVEADRSILTRFRYAYRYPPDCLVVRRIVSDISDAKNYPFDVGFDATGRLIFCEASNAVAEYTARVLDATLFTASFVDALAWKIAEEVALPLSRTDAIRRRSLEAYRQALAAALAADSLEMSVQRPESEYLTVRF